MWGGGGMMFPRIVVQEEARRLLDRFGIAYKEFEEGYYVAKSIEAVAKLTSAACDAGVEFFNLTSVEDVMIRGGDGRVGGLSSTGRPSIWPGCTSTRSPWPAPAPSTPPATTP